MTRPMTNLIKLEELGQLLLSVLLFFQLDYPWWTFPAFILLPDLSMLGYLVNARAGALVYNFFHHKLLAVTLLIVGYWTGISAIMLAGTIFLGHSALDRALGYGLKYNDNFHNTHLGWIGKKDSRIQDLIS